MRRLDQGKKTMKRRVQIDNKILFLPRKNKFDLSATKTKNGLQVVLRANILSYCNIARNKGISRERYLGGCDNPLNPTSSYGSRMGLWFKSSTVLVGIPVYNLLSSFEFVSLAHG